MAHPLDDEANLWLVLAQLADVPDERRGAHFACAAALVLPSGREQVAEGAVAGTLTREPLGTNGFGYDPIFVPGLAELARGGTLLAGGDPRTPGGAFAGLTTAEMPAEAKDAISHRGRALRALAPIIAALLG